ncbi:SsrA-binding protein SmpB [bacterium]|nr:SsrA-binding protein SmpB [bacterium]
MSIKIITENRKARFNYQILENFEAGLVLTGSEVKSIKNGEVNLGDAYGSIRNGEIFLLQAHVNPYKQAVYTNHEPLRPRKLLLHKREIQKLIGQVSEKGLTLIPLKLYLKEGKIKVDLGVAKAKNTVDKRDTIQKRESDREIRRALKNRQK